MKATLVIDDSVMRGLKARAALEGRPLSSLVEEYLCRARCRAIVAGTFASLDRWLGEGPRVALTWPIVYEFLRVTTHPAVLPTPLSFAEAHSVVAALLASARVDVLGATTNHAVALEGARDDVPETHGSRFDDLHTALVMREHGVRAIATADRHVREFSWIDVIDPLAIA